MKALPQRDKIQDSNNKRKIKVDNVIFVKTEQSMRWRRKRTINSINADTDQEVMNIMISADTISNNKLSPIANNDTIVNSNLGILKVTQRDTMHQRSKISNNSGINSFTLLITSVLMITCISSVLRNGKTQRPTTTVEPSMIIENRTNILLSTNIR